MDMKWTVYLLVFMVIATTVLGVVEMQYTAGADPYGGGQDSIFVRLTEFNIGEYSNPLQMMIGTFGAGIGWLKAWVDVVTFNYLYFTGSWVALRLLLMAPGLAWMVRMIMAWRGV